MGHVPADPVPEAGPGDDLPRRQHRGARAPGTRGARLLGPAGRSSSVGAFGERVAASFLTARGWTIVDRNRRFGFDEIDLLAERDGTRVAVEVKTRVGADPIEQFTDDQADRLRRAATAAGTSRCDLVTVLIGGRGIAVRWIRSVC